MWQTEFPTPQLMKFSLHFKYYFVLVHCPERQETKMFFCNISLQNYGDSDEIWYTVFWINLLKKWHKCFPHHLNNASTVPCETWNAHCARAIVELLWKETTAFIPPQLCAPDKPDLNLVLIAAYGKYYKKRCRKHASLIWSYRWRHWQMVVVMRTWPNLAHSASSHCFSSFRSVIHILYTFSCDTPTRFEVITDYCLNSGHFAFFT